MYYRRSAMRAMRYPKWLCLIFLASLAFCLPYALVCLRLFHGACSSNLVISNPILWYRFVAMAFKKSFRNGRKGGGCRQRSQRQHCGTQPSILLTFLVSCSWGSFINQERLLPCGSITSRLLPFAFSITSCIMSPLPPFPKFL